MEAPLRTIIINYDEESGNYLIGFMENLKLVRKEIAIHHDEIGVMVYYWMVHGTQKPKYHPVDSPVEHELRLKLEKD